MSLQELYNQKYQNETVTVPKLNPHGLSTNAYDDVARLLQKHVPDLQHKRLLDIGCGSGKLTFALSRLVGSAVGFDLSDVRIRAAETFMRAHSEFSTKDIQFRQGSADAAYPFPDASFDITVACAILEHVIDPFEMMTQIRRVTKPGGYVIVVVPNLAYVKHIKDICMGDLPLTGICDRNIERWERDGWDGAHLHYFTKRSMKRLLEHKGMEPLEWSGDGKFARMRRWSQLLVGGLNVIAKVK